MRDNYDFSKAIRNPYAAKLLEEEEKSTNSASSGFDCSLDDPHPSHLTA
jgi:hypothetical protein